jgi:nicotinate-nucleotide--dimethylbenzimidazole phosphoribosyltransferase
VVAVTASTRTVAAPRTTLTRIRSVKRLAKGGHVLSQEMAALVAGVPSVDGTVMSEALGLLRADGRRPGALGRLEHVWVLACGLQGRVPAAPFARRRLVAIVGDHPDQPGYAGSRVGELVARASAGAVLAERSHVGVRVVDMCLAADVPGAPDGMSRLRVRAGAGAIESEPAMTPAECQHAFDAGVATADAEVDAGTDLIVLTSLGRAPAAAATALVCAITGDAPVEAVGRAGVDDAMWMRRVVVVRDALRRSRPWLLDPMELLTELGGPDIAAMTGLLVGAALRRTPVLLDGLAPAAAALAAARLSARTVPHLIAGHRGGDTAHRLALKDLGLEPLLDLEITTDEGEGALLALGLLDASVAALQTLRPAT